MSSSRPVRRLATALILSLVAVGVLAGPADAKVKKRTFLVPVTYYNLASQAREGYCGAIGVAEFPQVLGAIEADATWRLRTSKDPVKKEQTYEGPLFDDELVYAALFETPATASWLLITGNSASGGNVGDCADGAEGLRLAIASKVKVTLTYEDDEDKVCVRLRGVQETAAQTYRKALSAWNKMTPGYLKDKNALAVNSLKARWERAKGMRAEACEKSFES